MDEEIIPSPKTADEQANNPVPESNVDSDDGGSDRVFEITSDLNISPVHESDEPPTISKPIPSVAPTPVITLTPTIEQPPKRPLNLMEETATDIAHTTPRITPANPTAKVVGIRPIPVLEMNAAAKKPPGITLQQSVANDTAPTMPSALSAQLDPNIKNLRTYESDVAESLSHKRTSAATIAIAENKKVDGGTAEVIKNVTTEPSHFFRNFLFILLSLILIAGGVYAAYYLYTVSPLAAALQKSPVTPTSTATTIGQTQTISSVVPADDRSFVSVDNLDSVTLFSRLNSEINKAVTPGTVREIVPVVGAGTSARRVTASEMVSDLVINNPDVLTRSLLPSWMLGVYADPTGNKSVFIVATNNFFQNAYSGMIAWEKTMPDDLRRFVSLAPLGNTTASSSANSSGTGSFNDVLTNSSLNGSAPTSFQAVQTYANLRGQFSSRIIRNKDVREYITDDGVTRFLYSFVSNDKLVITDKESTLIEIIDRLEKQSFTR